VIGSTAYWPALRRQLLDNARQVPPGGQENRCVEEPAGTSRLGHRAWTLMKDEIGVF
jgi:hypothetical protein